MSTRNGNVPMKESPLDLEKLEFPHLCKGHQLQSIMHIKCDNIHKALSTVAGVQEKFEKCNHLYLLL